MEKIININYQNRNISIEENAYHVFQEYEKELTNYFNKEESGDEIMSDLQHRMAEILEEKLKSGAPAITLQDIEEIKSNIGQPTDFGNQESEEPIQEKVETEEPNFNKKKLYRNKFKNERILAGVCSGLANYFAIDPIAVRIVFVLVTLLNLGTFFSFNLGILAYIILWATVPQQYMKPNVQQKLFRNPKDKVIAGVCSGLAQFFNIETWILRSIFLLPILIGIFSHNAPFRFHFLGSSLSSIMLVIYIPIKKTAITY